jgi:starch synthase
MTAKKKAAENAASDNKEIIGKKPVVPAKSVETSEKKPVVPAKSVETSEKKSVSPAEDVKTGEKKSTVTAEASGSAAEETAKKTPARKKSSSTGASKKKSSGRTSGSARKKSASSAAGKSSGRTRKQTGAKTSRTSRAKAAAKEPELKVLFATPECSPFVHTGGLGEVAGSLPAAVNRKSGGAIDCRVILPLYASVSQEYRDQMKFLGASEVHLAWRSQYMGVFELKKDGTTYYFIDNEYYFKRDGLYGYYDDGERFAFFSKAVLDSIGITGFEPDIIHANDWQTALVPVYQNSEYRRPFMKTVFTVHNIEYQGYYPHEFLEDVIGLPEGEGYVVEFEDGVNLMKGGIESCNTFTTVSPSYAGELCSPVYAHGLDGIVSRNRWKLRGILNGIDTEKYDPAHDKFIAATYTADDLTGKEKCRASLQESLALPVREVPVITLISRLVPAKGLDLVRAVIDGVLGSEDVQFILLGTGYPEYEEFFRGVEWRHRDKARCLIEFSSEISHRIYAGGDILLVPSLSEPCGLTQMIGCRYGDVPLVRNTGGLRDSITDCTLGDGSGFVFDSFDPDSFYHTLMNAIVRFHDRENWTNLVRHDMGLDFGWERSAGEYIEMYRDTAGK